MKIYPQPHLLRVVILVSCAVILIWFVIWRSLAGYLADAAPQSALWLNSRQPQALINLADQSINSVAAEIPATVPSGVSQAQSGAPDQPAHLADKPSDGSENLDRTFATIDQYPSIDVPKIRDRVETALTNEPLNAHGLRILGQLAEISKDDENALRYMTAAARISSHEGIAVYWLMRKSTQANDYNHAIAYADTLLRTNPGLDAFAMPVLTHFVEQKASNAAVKSLLMSDPPWRERYFAALPGEVTDARTPLDLLSALRATATPPTSDEIGRYLNFLIEHKIYELAYYTWLQFLSADDLRRAAWLYNGSFDEVPSGLPFDWVITQGTGVAIDIVPRQDKSDAHALLVDFLYGRVDYHSVNELVVLSPGTYQFDGHYNGKLVGPRGLKWRIVCADAKTRIGESLMISGTTSSWKDFQFTFIVPAADCRAQYVQLDLDARMASEELVSGQMLFTGLHISRVSNPRAEPASRN